MQKNTDDKHEFDHYKDIYSDSINLELQKYGGEDQNLYLKIKSSHLSKFIWKYCSKKKVKVLDFGCGHGLMHKFFKGNLEITGVDPAAKVIKMAKKINKKNLYEVFNGKDLPFPSHHFDFTFAVCVFHHIKTQDRLAAIKEMKRVTKPGGAVLIYEHNPLNPITLKIVNNCPLDKNAKLLKTQETKDLMSSAGIVKIKKEFIIFFPFKAKFFRLIEASLRNIPLGAQYVLSGIVEE